MIEDYSEMTAEEYENNISDKAEFEYDKAKEEKGIAEWEKDQDDLANARSVENRLEKLENQLNFIKNNNCSCNLGTCEVCVCITDIKGVLVNGLV